MRRTPETVRQLQASGQKKWYIRMRTISIFCCLLCAMWTEGAGKNVEGFEGGDVSFQCSHALAWKNRKYFCKNECKESEDILVTVRSGSRAKSGRITLVDLGNGDFTVTFSQLQLSDSGRYWCGVDRPGFDTYNEVILTVREVMATVIPDASTTSIYQDISNSTDSTFEQQTSYTSGASNQSTVSNCTMGEEPISSTRTVLHATIGGVVTLTVLLLAARCRKRREISKHRRQLCPNSADAVSAVYEVEIDCEYDNIGEVPSIQMLSERSSGSHHPKQDPPTSASTGAECSAPVHIYENICINTAGAIYSNIRKDHHITSRTHTELLPLKIPGRTGDVLENNQLNQQQWETL